MVLMTLLFLKLIFVPLDAVALFGIPLPVMLGMMY
jgi:hypothetical protein